jgi:hypothetical protein
MTARCIVRGDSCVEITHAVVGSLYQLPAANDKAASFILGRVLAGGAVIETRYLAWCLIRFETADFYCR